MNTVTCTCPICSKSFEKPKNEYNRRIKINSPMYCSRKCAGHSLFKNFGDKANKVPPKSPKANPFKYYLRNAKKRLKFFDITLEDLQEVWNNQKGVCPYSKISLQLNNHSHRIKDRRYTASLDRIDSSKGYTKDNIQFVSLCINYMKAELSNEEVHDFLKEIVNNLSTVS